MAHLLLARTEPVNGLALIGAADHSSSSSPASSDHHISGSAAAARRKSAAAIMNGEANGHARKSSQANGHARQPSQGLKPPAVASCGGSEAADDVSAAKTRTPKRTRRGETMLRFPFISCYFIPAFYIFLYARFPNLVICLSSFVTSVEMFMVIERLIEVFSPASLLPTDNTRSETFKADVKPESRIVEGGTSRE